MGNYYITGDTHRHYDIDKIKRFNKECDKLIICGDFGLPYKSYLDNKSSIVWSSEDKALLSMYNSLPYEILFIDGNHENFDILDNILVEKRFGGSVNKISENITHLRRGELYNIDGKIVWTFGGATSVGNHLRTEGFNWWHREQASMAEMDYGTRQLESVNYEVDYIITHIPPDIIIRLVFNNSVSCPTALYLDYVFQRVKYKHWYCGHMHADKEIEEYNMSILFNDIIKLK